MTDRQNLPEIWLFTDPRMNDDLWAAVDRLPRHSGIVMRHYDAIERLAIGMRLAAAARRGRHTLLVAGDARLAKRIGAVGTHLPTFGPIIEGVMTAAAHNPADIVRACRAGARMIFISPVFTTRSHPDGPSLGRIGFGRLARLSPVPVAALGGMHAARFTSLRPLGACAWGAIDAFL